MKCPRCQRPLHPSQDPEAAGYCFSCGDIYVPIRPADVAGELAYEQAPNGVKLRQRSPSRSRLLTGDGCDESPSCFTCPLEECKYVTPPDEEDEEPMNHEDEPTTLATLSTRQLARQIINSLELLAVEHAKASARIEGVRDEATKLVKIGQLCEADIPSNLLALAGKAPKTAKPKAAKPGAVPRAPGLLPNEWVCPDCGHKTVSRWVRRHQESDCPKAPVMAGSASS